MINTEAKKGFTLLELLIVIAIIAILSAILIFILNPAQTLRKARDSQRISDFATVNSSIGLYITTVNLATNPLCAGIATSTIFASVPASHATLAAGCAATTTTWTQRATLTAAAQVDGTGWIPVNFTKIPDGSPIGSLPQDPSIGSAADWTGITCVTNTEPAYRFVCNNVAGTWEMDATLESNEFAAKKGADGGGNANRYEEGTNKTLVP